MADRSVATTDTLETFRTTYNSTAGDVGDISSLTGASGIIASATDIVEAVTLMNTEVTAIKAGTAVFETKLTFEGKKILPDGKLSDELYSMLDWLQTSENLIWKVARLRDAIKSPEVFDLNDWMGRYVVATVEMNTYNEKTNPQFKNLSYSSFNDKMPPIPSAKEESNQSASQPVQSENPSEDISEEIPF